MAISSYNFPQFDRSDVNFYFTLCDIYFVKAGIVNEQGKFQALTLNLPSEILASVKTLVSEPSRNNPFTNLKNALILEFAQSDEVRFNSLLNDLKFDGSCKLLYNSIIHLSEGFHFHESAIKAFFFARLPKDLRLHANSFPEDLTIQQIINRLDSAFVILNEGVKVPSALNARLDNVDAKLNVFTSKLDFLTSQISFSKSQNDNSSLPQSNRAPFHSNNSGNLCYYHQRFGNRAFRCIEPCQFKKN